MYFYNTLIYVYECVNQYGKMHCGIIIKNEKLDIACFKDWIRRDSMAGHSGEVKNATELQLSFLAGTKANILCR